MTAFNATEIRAVALATGLLLLGAAARLGLGPGPAQFEWQPVERAARPESANLVETAGRVAEALDAEARANRPLSPGERIDPNTASVEDLRRLPGIGPSRAAAIVAERNVGGAFAGIDDLTRVPGIGPISVAKLAPHLNIGPPSGSAGPARSGPGGAVDVNRAQIKELQQITGIGPVLASRIVETRSRLGRFRDADDLLLVPGIGPAVLARIRGQVRF